MLSIILQCRFIANLAEKTRIFFISRRRQREKSQVCWNLPFTFSFLSTCFIDFSCLESPIHHPDYILHPFPSDLRASSAQGTREETDLGGEDWVRELRAKNSWTTPSHLLFLPFYALQRLLFNQNINAANKRRRRSSGKNAKPSTESSKRKMEDFPSLRTRAIAIVRFSWNIFLFSPPLKSRERRNKGGRGGRGSEDLPESSNPLHVLF